MIKLKDVKSGHAFGIVFSDSLIQMTCLIMFILVMLFMIPHAKESKKSDLESGQICAEIIWPSRDIDLDLWGHVPDEPDTVGFSYMHSEHMSLLKDVTGFNNNPSHIMQEIMCSQDVLPGEWVFNVYYFSNHESELNGLSPNDPRKSVLVTMNIHIQHGSSKTDSGQTLTGSYTLTHEGEEKTMFRFRIGNDGKLIQESINSKNISLVKGWHRE